ncbi:predicted protein [Naegleria gruberi]|uniref:Predicted protein n=1 Tax=Naegleria gruberi TaxID=5762 RepID=D2W0I2_NAEGR|nr:uncharacterized protein NAEGRDRAFT_74868 [Naegleria gruberi]EFC37483.1 predicted protein [Naegleria gruberi]|eukprot:XP_002670227.1 predicted protein [Naegleria gruberi strain NEG-M]
MNNNSSSLPSNNTSTLTTDSNNSINMLKNNKTDLNIVLTSTTSSQSLSNNQQHELPISSDVQPQFSTSELEGNIPLIDDSNISNLFLSQNAQQAIYSSSFNCNQQDHVGDEEEMVSSELSERKSGASVSNTSSLLNLILSSNNNNNTRHSSAGMNSSQAQQHVLNSVSNNQNSNPSQTSSFLQHLIQQQLIHNSSSSNNPTSFELYTLVNPATVSSNSISTDLDSVLLTTSTNYIRNNDEIDSDSNMIFMSSAATLPSTSCDSLLIGGGHNIIKHVQPQQPPQQQLFKTNIITSSSLTNCSGNHRGSVAVIPDNNNHNHNYQHLEEANNNSLKISVGGATEIDLATVNNKSAGNSNTGISDLNFHNNNNTSASPGSSLLSLMAGDGSSNMNINTNTNNNQIVMNNNNNNITGMNSTVGGGTRSSPSEANNYIMNSLNSNSFNSGQHHNNSSSTISNNNTSLSSNNNNNMNSHHQPPLHHNHSSQHSLMQSNNYNNGNVQNLPQHNTSSPPLVPNTHHHMLSLNPLSSQTNKASNMMMVGSTPPQQSSAAAATSIHPSSAGTLSSSPPLLYNGSSNNNLYPQQQQQQQHFNYSATMMMNNQSTSNNNTTTTAGPYGLKQNSTNMGLSGMMMKPDPHTTPSPSNHSSSTNGFNYNSQQTQYNNGGVIDNGYQHQQQPHQQNNVMYSNQPMSSSNHHNVTSASPNLSMDHQQGNIQFQFHQHTPNQKKRGRQSNSNTPQTYQFQYYNGNTFTSNGTKVTNTPQSTFQQSSYQPQPIMNNQQQIIHNFTPAPQQNFSNSNSSSGNAPSLMYNTNNNNTNGNMNSPASGIPREIEPFSSAETFNDEEDEDDDDEEENEDDDCEYHPIACVQCRSLHKKCDKKLPACTKCVSRGVECTYRTPKRNTSQPLPKKKKKKKNKSVSNKSSQPSQSVNLLVKTKVLDLYFTYLCPDFPLIDRSEMEFYLSDACPVGTPNKKEMEVLFMAIRALCEYRVGSVESGVKAVQEARQALSTVFTDYSNFYVACSYCFMSYVESLNHDIKTANFFLKLVDYHLQDIPTDQLDEKQQILKRYHAFAKTSVSNRLLNDFTGNVMDVIKQIPQLYSLSTGQSLPPEFQNIVNQEITSSNYQETLDVVETLFKLLHVQTDNLAKPVDIKDLRRIDLVYILMTNGLKIAILTKAGERKDLIEESALKITYTTYSQLYAFSSVDMMGYVALGARVHYHIVRAIEAGQRSNFTNGIISLDGKIGPIDYYEILASDLRAINLLKRYLRTPSPYFENLCSDIQTLLQNRGKGVIQSSPPTTLNTEFPNSQPVYNLDSTITQN